MGSLAMLIGVIAIIVGVILLFTVVGAAVGVPLIFQGLIFFIIGHIYNDVREIKRMVSK
jgi:uncharacterized membrane protein HdeD (DUF308 family)